MQGATAEAGSGLPPLGHLDPTLEGRAMYVFAVYMIDDSAGILVEHYWTECQTEAGALQECRRLQANGIPANYKLEDAIELA